MDDSDSVIVCPQCKSKEVVKGKMFKGDTKFGCLTCGFRGNSFFRMSKEEAKKLPGKPKNFSEDIFKMAEISRNDKKSRFSFVRTAELIMLGVFIVLVLLVLFALFFYI